MIPANVFPWQRVLRDVKSYVQYPLWNWKGRPGPDNHYYKMARIARLARQHGCDTLIETGTFYGQTVHYATRYFKRVMSVEIFPPLYDYNLRQFGSEPKVRLFHGDSSTTLARMIGEAEGRIVYWLDGHYSGTGTGIGAAVSPILAELAIIKAQNRRGDCILIDDRRLFGHDDGYPTMGQTVEALRAIDENYQITFDYDCIVATPRG